MQLLALAFLALAASSSEAVNKIKCYTCNSEDPNCSDPINTDVLQPKECTNDITNNILGGLNTGLKGIGNFFGLEKTPQIDATFVCLKGAYTQTDKDGKDQKIVVRTCALGGTKVCDTLLSKSKEQGMKDIFCEECSTDGCNGSSSIHAAAFILVSAVALLLASR